MSIFDLVSGFAVLIYAIGAVALGLFVLMLVALYRHFKPRRGKK